MPAYLPEFNLSVLEMPAQMLEGPPSSVFWGAGSDFYHVWKIDIKYQMLAVFEELAGFEMLEAV